MTIYNFAAGPAMMPAPVIKQIQDELPSLHGSGMSILEVSHRGQDFEKIIEDAEADLRELMAIPDDYAVLFMQGGGTGQFAAAPMNLARQFKRIAVLDSGQWAARADAEARRLGFTSDVLASTKTDRYTTLPALPEPLPQDQYDYVHICVNNTIEGTMFRQLPATETTPLVGDMSSNILAQRYNVRDFGMIFAGAQKNLGPAGVTVVIVRRDLLGDAKHVPSAFDYQLFDAKHSLYNTPPVFAIYAVGLVLKWLKEQGGVDEMQRRNEAKSQLLYDYLDQSRLFFNPVKPADRSITNVPFMTGDADLDAAVVTAATAHGLLNLKGHRSVGGLRASLYNAMPLAGAEALVDFLNDFEKHH
ncbi:3-phosphoserine/phosphohydroxythreonine transaminase [Lacticaseibacillus pabuli]|uniref:Phosphoserine aminotransferase n=1 Tax=Lacticaseibacillus pabuli TaxID=3025672 RepID=A0ABY7WUW3_9LACO|nr:3-phosphoserine/phosphohydroxythreonine transaminase [Lacticaseibacillus sp. KACC 23028]WDF82791.1 3-phosphoserine/phosphohydroxythreonine transaminase [Lacticaseibacillus sp. KACC 23028]